MMIVLALLTPILGMALLLSLQLLETRMFRERGSVVPSSTSKPPPIPAWRERHPARGARTTRRGPPPRIRP